MAHQHGLHLQGDHVDAADHLLVVDPTQVLNETIAVSTPLPDPCEPGVVASSLV